MLSSGDRESLIIIILQIYNINLFLVFIILLFLYNMLIDFFWTHVFLKNAWGYSINFVYLFYL